MKDRDMFKKNLFLLCALTSVSAPIAADSSHEEDTVDVAKGNCKKFNNIRVCNNGLFGGSVTAQSFITSNGPLFNGLRNWAVFSNNAEIAGNGTVPFSATPLFNNTAGITNAGGIITLPVPGIFAVIYTVRVTATPPLVGDFVATLQQGAGAIFDILNQPAINTVTDALTAGNSVQNQLTGYAIITTTDTTNNQIELVVLFDTGYTIPAAEAVGDANAQIAIFQLN
jgi:hypothetical protein